MRKLLLAFLAPLAFLVAPTVSAQAVKDVDPPLWVVKDEDTTIYLFGTVHMLPQGLGWFDDGVKAAFDASDELVMELADPMGPETMAAMNKYSTYADGPSLTERMSPEQREAFLAAAKKAGVDPAMLERQKPWMAAMSLSMVPLMKAGYNPFAGPEMILLPAAKAAGKPVSGLETAEEQLGLFNAQSEAKQLEGLVVAAKSVDEAAPMMNKMLDAWGRGDEAGIVAFVEESPGSSPELTKALFADRNARWAEWIDQRMERPGTLFVAVGVGHLVGKDSVQDYLAKHQHKAERVAY